jgi:hypothetical protein
MRARPHEMAVVRLPAHIAVACEVELHGRQLPCGRLQQVGTFHSRQAPDKQDHPPVHRDSELGSRPGLLSGAEEHRVDSARNVHDLGRIGAEFIDEPLRDLLADGDQAVGPPDHMALQLRVDPPAMGLDQRVASMEGDDQGAAAEERRDKRGMESVVCVDEVAVGAHAGSDTPQGEGQIRRGGPVSLGDDPHGDQFSQRAHLFVDEDAPFGRARTRVHVGDDEHAQVRRGWL